MEAHRNGARLANVDQNGLTAILVEAGASLMRTDYQVSEKECEGCLLLIID